MTISLGYLILAILATAIITYLLAKSVLDKNGIGLKKTNNQQQKSIEKLEKERKKQDKLIKKWQGKSEEWQLKYEAAETKHNQQSSNDKIALKALEAKEVEKTNTIQKMQNELLRNGDKINMQKDEIEKLKERYETDLHDSKNWKPIKAKLEKQLKSYEHSINESKVSITKLNEKLSKQTGEINELAKTQKKMRLLQTDKNKLEKDIKYWEQKHYDTHHELASLKEQFAALKSKNIALEQELNGDHLVKKEMMESIKEFKTKFVNVNNQYHKLLEKVDNQASTN